MSLLASSKGSAPLSSANLTEGTKREEIRSPSLSDLPSLKETKRAESLDQLEIIARRAIGLHLKSLGIEFSSTALEELFDLFTNNINSLMSNLQRITQTQRRFKASRKDLRILLKDVGLSLSEVENEIIRTKSNSKELVSKRKELEKLANEIARDSEGHDIDSQNASYVFFSHDHEDVLQLLPPKHKRVQSILPWLPRFPPDHTYLRTPNYTERITDQKVVRTKIAEESILGEKALDNLINYLNGLEEDVNNQSESSAQSDVSKADEDNVDFKKESLDEVKGLNIWAVRNEKRFDIVGYANARLKYLNNKKEKLNNRQKGVNSDYLNLIQNLSPFVPHEPGIIDSSSFVEKQLDLVLGSLSSIQKKNIEREKERKVLLNEAKKKREELQKKNELQFEGFGSLGGAEGEDDGFGDFENFNTTKDLSEFDFLMQDNNDLDKTNLEKDSGKQVVDLDGDHSVNTNNINASDFPMSLVQDASELDEKLDYRKDTTSNHSSINFSEDVRSQVVVDASSQSDTLQPDTAIDNSHTQSVNGEFSNDDGEGDDEDLFENVTLE